MGLGYDNFALVRYRVGDGTTSTENIPADEIVTIFPNPARGFLNVEITPEARAGQPLMYRIFSTNGQLVKSGMLGNNISIIAVKDLPAGSYFFEVLTKEEPLLVQQIIIN